MTKKKEGKNSSREKAEKGSEEKRSEKGKFYKWTHTPTPRQSSIQDESVVSVGRGHCGRRFITILFPSKPSLTPSRRKSKVHRNRLHIVSESLRQSLVSLCASVAVARAAVNPFGTRSLARFHPEREGGKSQSILSIFRWPHTTPSPFSLLL